MDMNDIGAKCLDCGGKGKIYVFLPPDGGEFELCEKCSGVGRIYKSEWEKDRQLGRL